MAQSVHAKRAEHIKAANKTGTKYKKVSGLLAPPVRNSNSDSDNPTLQNEMGSALAAQLGQATLQLLQKNLNIKPTLEIRPGYQFNVIVTKDLVFREPYKAER